MLARLEPTNNSHSLSFTHVRPISYFFLLVCLLKFKTLMGGVIAYNVDRVNMTAYVMVVGKVEVEWSKMNF